jgi:hypothetical protein
MYLSKEQQQQQQQQQQQSLAAASAQQTAASSPAPMFDILMSADRLYIAQRTAVLLHKGCVFICCCT